MLSNLTESERESVKRVINRLLSVNFLVREQDRDDYLLVRRHFDHLQVFFRLMGWELTLDQLHECVFLDSGERAHRRSLSREESIWLLVLRLIYEEKRGELNLSQFPLTTLHEIRAKYETFGLPVINRTRLQEHIRLATRYQLIQVLDSDIRADDCRFQLYHTLVHVVDAGQVEKLEAMLMNYRTGGGEVEMDEETPAS